MMDRVKLPIFLKERQIFKETDDISIEEIGDGNLNLVFIAKS